MNAWQQAGFALAAFGAVAAGPGVRGSGDAAGYTFRKPPVNSMGVKSMAELRGKPVLIDFWGTR